MELRYWLLNNKRVQKQKGAWGDEIVTDLAVILIEGMKNLIYMSFTRMREMYS